MSILSGAHLRADAPDDRKEAARRLGMARTEKKAVAARANGAKNTFTEATRAKLRAAQAARRQRERAQREASGSVAAPTSPEPKKKPGRPKKQVEAQPTPKRPVGRPRKQDAQ